MNPNKPAPQANLAEFLDHIKSPDAGTRLAAWHSAGPMGAGAIAPLADIAAGDDKAAAKAAQGAMDRIGHYAARPGAKADAEAVSAELLKVAGSSKPRMVRANAITLLGTTGDSRVVPGLGKLLTDPDLREDARMALERIPGAASETALKTAEKQAEANHSDYTANLKQSLHNRHLTLKTAGILTK